MSPVGNLSRHPPRPVSEVEWEDLLLRIEVMPRALRFALEEMGRDSSRVAEVLRDLAENEDRARRFLEAALGLEANSVPTADEATQPIALKADAMDRFMRLRVRNFAMAQRRGIAIWELSVPVESGERATVHQLFAYLAETDARALKALRAIRERSGAC